MVRDCSVRLAFVSDAKELIMDGKNLDVKVAVPRGELI